MSAGPAAPPPAPPLTPELPGTGGARRGPEDFVVEEIPAYLPSGAGEHCMVRMRKRGLTTPEAVSRLCRALGVPPGAAGYAGLKDRDGVTTQWVSVPGVAPRQVLEARVEGIQLLEAGLHRNKLRTGHLRGNHFTVTLWGCHPDAAARARAVLERLAALGLPNYFGEQRFGRHGDNGVRGLAAVQGDARLPRDRLQRRLLLSAAQSQLFNELLRGRLEGGRLRTLQGGEVLQRVDSGACFVSEQREHDQPRLEAGEVVISGPICGPRMMRPLEGSPARAEEDAVLRAHRVAPASFGRFGRLARGGRRPLLVALERPTVATVQRQGETGLALGFTLPAGSYATVVLREVVKSGD